MKILHAYPEITSRGGRPHDCRQLATHLARIGNDVRVVGLARPEENGRIFPDETVGVEVIRPGLAHLARFTGVLKEFEPDIVHFTGGPRIPVQNSWARQARRLGIPFVLSGCGNLSEPTFRHRWGTKPNYFYHQWMKRLYYTAFDSHLITESAFVHTASNTEAEIATKLGAQATVTIPFGMDRRWIRDTHRPIDATATPIVFTYLGRLSTIHKGLDLILDAFELLTAKGLGDQIKLILAGTSENGSMDALKSAAAAAGITNVEFPGGLWGDDKHKLWDETHYFLHMCRFNGFALATREAVGQGIPIIATMESDFGDWVKRFNMGAVVELSGASLASKIEYLLVQHDQYPALCNGAVEYSRATTWDNIAADMDVAYRSVLGSEPGTATFRVGNRLRPSG